MDVGQVFRKTSGLAQKRTRKLNRSISVCSNLPDSLGVPQRAGGTRAWLEDDTHVLAVFPAHPHTTSVKTRTGRHHLSPPTSPSTSSSRCLPGRLRLLIQQTDNGSSKAPVPGCLVWIPFSHRHSFPFKTPVDETIPSG